MKTILIKSPDNGGDRIPTCHPLSPNEASYSGIWLQQLVLMNKGVPWASLDNPDWLKKKKTLGLFPEADSKTPLLKTTPTQFNKHGEIELLPTMDEIEPSF